MNRLQAELVRAIRHRLIDLGWTGTEFCRRAGISQAAWSGITTGRKGTTLDMAQRLAETAGLALVFTVAGNADFPPPPPVSGGKPPAEAENGGNGPYAAEKRPSGGPADRENAVLSPDGYPRAYAHPECPAPSYVSKAKAGPPP